MRPIMLSAVSSEPATTVQNRSVLDTTREVVHRPTGRNPFDPWFPDCNPMPFYSSAVANLTAYSAVLSNLA
jgi:hypothetical protein